VKTAKKLPVEGVKPGFTVTKPLRPLRAVQVMFFSGASYEEMERELEGLKSAGVDTVILRVFHNTGDRHHRFVEPRSPAGVYFKTDHAPVVADVLAKVLESAHEKGLKVFAWMTTRHADYGLEGMAELACKGYDIATGKIVRCRGLDMFNEKAVRHLEGLFSDLASYPIDGVLFQDDLILRHTEGFGAHAERLFKKQRGISIDPAKFYIRGTGTASVLYTASFWEWAAWKNKRLLTVAGRLKRAVRERNPRVEFAINMMYESVTNPPYALAWLSQDLATAATAGFDYYSIMAYHRQMSEELEKSPGEIKEIIGKMVEEALRVRTIEDVSIAVVPYRVDFPFYELGKTGAKGPGKDNGYNPTRAGNVKDF
jgi:biofilm PGA synthesis lipoprotein PgaB